MEIPLSQDDIRLLNVSILTSVEQVMVLLPRLGKLGQFRSTRLGVTICDLQLRKVITPSSELRFGCS